MYLNIVNGEISTCNIFADHYWTRSYIKIIRHYKLNPPAKEEYTETHHIIPKSFFVASGNKTGWILGDQNCPENLVKLPAKAHFIVHLILTKICVNDYDTYKMISAIGYMMNNNSNHHYDRRLTSALYQKLRKEQSLQAKRRFLGRKFSAEHSRRKSLAQTGSRNHRYGKANPNNPKLYGKDNGMFGKKHSPESLALMRENRAKVKAHLTDECREKLSTACKNKLWYNNGQISKRYYEGENPPEYVKGRLRAAMNA